MDAEGCAAGHFLTLNIKKMPKEIFQIPGKTWWVKYSDEHGWGCETGNGPLWFAEKRNFMPLLPLLESEVNLAKELVVNGVRRAELPSTVADNFPFEDLIIYALGWETEYWPKDAIEWLESGYPLNSEIVKWLRTVSEKRHYHQRTRHRAIALARKWEGRDV